MSNEMYLAMGSPLEPQVVGDQETHVRRYLLEPDGGYFWLRIWTDGSGRIDFAPDVGCHTVGPVS